MKHINRIFISLLFYINLAVVMSVPLYAQQRKNLQILVEAPSTATEELRWLTLARRITELENTDPWKQGEEELTQANSDAIDAIEKLSAQLNKLTEEQITQAFCYMLDHATNDTFRLRSSGNLLSISPSAETVHYVRPFFEKLPDKFKLDLLSTPIFDAVMLRPEVPEFREFPLLILQKGATKNTVSDDLLSQAALLLVVRTSVTEKKAMHEALLRHPTAGGIWNALTQINALTPQEVQKARQNFSLGKNHPGRRLTFAAVLSPYDPKMREIVRQAVETEMKAKADFDFTGIVMKQRPNVQQLWQLQDKARPAALAVLRFWELKQALPYLRRVLRAKNPMVRRLAMPTLAMRAPQEVIQAARRPDSRKTLMHWKYGLALSALLYPQFQPQVAQLLADDDDKREGTEEVEENFREVVQELRIKGVLNAF